MTAALPDVAREAAVAAGQVLLAERSRVRAEGATATKSSVTDPVTRADIAAQRAVADVVTAARPRDGILAEEGLDRPGSTGWRWIVDPLDGTVNYLYGRDEWAVSIAVQAPSGATAAAVVLAPALGLTCTAVLGEGCWLDGQRMTVRDCADLATAVIGTGFSYGAATRADQAAMLARLLPQVADIRRCGSAALDLVAVATGRADAFYEDDLAPWDWAAGALLASEAGAVVTPLSPAANRSGVLAAAPGIAEALAQALEEPHA